jgi:hypothetical protein
VSSTTIYALDDGLLGGGKPEGASCPWQYPSRPKCGPTLLIWVNKVLRAAKGGGGIG